MATRPTRRAAFPAAAALLVSLSGCSGCGGSSGPVVTPSTPGFLPPLPPLAAGTGRYTRLDLARWTVSPENPLTARVFVNRTWKLFFGYGISRSLEESGAQGQLPTHPELLDWLAARLVADGWSVKALHRLMVLSSAYQQSAVGGSGRTPVLLDGRRDGDHTTVLHEKRRGGVHELARDRGWPLQGADHLGEPVRRPGVRDGRSANVVGAILD